MILLQELFATTYFCQEQKKEHFLLAESTEESSLLERFQGLAKELGVVSEGHYCCSCTSAFPPVSASTILILPPTPISFLLKPLYRLGALEISR